MNDKDIIQLYLNRDQRALSELQRSMGNTALLLQKIS